jgi:hypothetical protein
MTRVRIIDDRHAHLSVSPLGSSMTGMPILGDH